MPVWMAGFDWSTGTPLVTSETNSPIPVNTITGGMSGPIFSGLPARAAVSEVRGDELDWAGRSRS